MSRCEYCGAKSEYANSRFVNGTIVIPFAELGIPGQIAFVRRMARLIDEHLKTFEDKHLTVVNYPPEEG